MRSEREIASSTYKFEKDVSNQLNGRPGFHPLLDVLQEFEAQIAKDRDVGKHPLLLFGSDHAFNLWQVILEEDSTGSKKTWTLP